MARTNRNTTGFPSGIPYIIGNEAAERFSFYGMKAILTVFMTEYLMMNEVESGIWYHDFVSSAYFFPIIGALVADLFLGKYKTIISLSIVYCLGHLVLALYETQTGLGVGLTLIAIGSGGIKPCVSAHVGDQFTKHNKHLLEKVFSYFYLAINVGAFLAIMLTPLLLQHVGPAVAFGLPGLLMLIATIVFYAGRNEFIAVPAKPESLAKDLFSANGLKIVGRLLIIYVFIAFFWSLFDQQGSSWIQQARNDLMDKHIFGFELLPSQIQSFNALFILIFVPIFTFFVYPFINKFVNFSYMWKITAGLIVAGSSFLFVGYAEGLIEQGQEVSVWWQITAMIVITAAEVMVSITALEFSYTQAPNSMKSFIMGLYLLSVSMGNQVVSVTNSFLTEEAQLTAVSASDHTYLEIENSDYLVEGTKVQLDKVGDIKILTESEDEDGNTKIDTAGLSGTFRAINIDESGKRFEIVDINNNPVKTINTLDEEVTIGINKVSGANYFYLFAGMSTVAGLLFVFVALFYKEQTFIQDEDTDPADPYLTEN